MTSCLAAHLDTCALSESGELFWGLVWNQSGPCLDTQWFPCCEGTGISQSSPAVPYGTINSVVTCDLRRRWSRVQSVTSDHAEYLRFAHQHHQPAAMSHSGHSKARRVRHQNCLIALEWSLEKQASADFLKGQCLTASHPHDPWLVGTAFAWHSPLKPSIIALDQPARYHDLSSHLTSDLWIIHGLEHLTRSESRGTLERIIQSAYHGCIAIWALLPHHLSPDQRQNRQRPVSRYVESLKQRSPSYFISESTRRKWNGVTDLCGLR